MIHERAMLCDLTMTSFTGLKTSKKDTADLLETKSAQRGAASVVVRLIPSAALAPITSVTTKIRTVHKTLTAPWSDAADILPTTLFMEHSQLMNDGFAERDEAVTEFCRIYPQLEPAARQSLGDLDFERLWVPVDQVRAAFTNKVRHWPIPQGTDFRCDLDENDLARVKAQADADAREMWQGAMSNIQTRIVTVMQAMIEKLEAYKIEPDGRVGNTFRDSIFDSAANLLAIMPHFNIENDPAMNHAIASINKTISSFRPDTLRHSPSARQETINNAKVVVGLFS